MSPSAAAQLCFEGEGISGSVFRIRPHEPCSSIPSVGEQQRHSILEQLRGLPEPRLRLCSTKGSQKRGEGAANTRIHVCAAFSNVGCGSWILITTILLTPGEDSFYVGHVVVCLLTKMAQLCPPALEGTVLERRKDLPKATWPVSGRAGPGKW